MADVGYSDEYSIYMTMGGIRFLTNKTSIKIMGLLTASEMTVTEIAAALQESKSSIQSNMMKLSRWGLVSSYVDPDDKRRVIYILSAMLLIKSMAPGEDAESVTEDIIRRILKMDDHHKNAIMLSSIMPYRMGATILPLMARVSGMITEHFMPDVEGLSDEEFKAAISDLAKKIKFPDVTVEIGERKSATIDCRNMNPIEIRIIRGLFSGFFNRFLDKRYGEWYYHDAHSVSADGILTIEYSRYKGNYENVNYLMSHKSVYDEHENWPFAIISKDDSSVLFGNDSQIRILMALNGTKKSLKDLSEELNIPSVTVHMNISKLMEEGVVVADNSTRSKYVYYTLNAAPVVLPFVGDREPIDNYNEYLRILGQDPANFFELVSAVVLSIFHEAGIDAWHLLVNTGSLVSSIIVKDNPDMEAQDFLDFICMLSRQTSSELSIKTYIPLCFRVEGRYGNTEMARYVSPVFVGLVESGLKLITGEDRKVYFDIDKWNQQ